MTNQRTSRTAIIAITLLAASCGKRDDNAPPKIALDQSSCSECGMIISDERYASATIVRLADGRTDPRLFDDINCLVLHQTTGPALDIAARWVHDHGTLAWIPAEQAHFVISSAFSTPMMSHVAAFESADSARAAATGASDARTLTFDEIVSLFRPAPR